MVFISIRYDDTDGSFVGKASPDGDCPALLFCFSCLPFFFFSFVTTKQKNKTSLDSAGSEVVDKSVPTYLLTLFLRFGVSIFGNFPQFWMFLPTLPDWSK